MTQSTADRSERKSPLSPVGAYVEKRIHEWQQDYLRRRPEAMAALAKLRRGVGKDVGAVPELWPYILDGLPGDDGGDNPTRAERAVYTALTLYAVHQQSRQRAMHVPGTSLGAAVRRLRTQAPSEAAVRRRFEALGTAEDFSEVVHHARGLITQLRGADIPLDYGAFADDLLRLQDRRFANQVRLRWGRDFYRATRDTDSASTDSTTGTDNEQEETAA